MSSHLSSSNLISFYLILKASRLSLLVSYTVILSYLILTYLNLNISRSLASVLLTVSDLLSPPHPLRTFSPPICSISSHLGGGPFA